MLSVIIITKNEASHIGRCLESVSWADEIVVLDSGSNDATIAICREYTDKVYEKDWPGFGIQKQRALGKAQGDWVLSIDADEVVTTELRMEIEKALQQEQFQGYNIPRLSSYCGRQIRHGGWWPDHVLRLFRRNCSQFTDSVVHEHVIVQGQIGQLAAPLLHDAFVNLDEVLHKVNCYSTLGAALLYQRGVRSSLGKAILKGFWTFIRTYWLQAAFLDGRQGLMLSISNAEGTYYKYVKLLELEKRSTHHE
ncbi:Lipopolysaccharide core biosynthesis glycosyltransferase WaaE [Candidatus Methylobacter favarea]|uniref:Lipopolysaccharide core biosynthesis glycosyltransferase WaaE n=1 Tax=Candidatus Methylobacter favarea TaxID=2707345 RepID=A0A8S0YAN7_9GAMM|nr:glycosyltransferase family 2 protein [Candidatus Methylobacter favarea]CAA9892277.1 Lipopolysaccharide core biosynthesis glycosyltransferase WaaE [Candidatus Methylobacter favarea]